jgi:hypothetical protein
MESPVFPLRRQDFILDGPAVFSSKGCNRRRGAYADARGGISDAEAKGENWSISERPRARSASLRTWRPADHVEGCKPELWRTGHTWCRKKKPAWTLAEGYRSTHLWRWSSRGTTQRYWSKPRRRADGRGVSGRRTRGERLVRDAEDDQNDQSGSDSHCKQSGGWLNSHVQLRNGQV